MLAGPDQMSESCRDVPRTVVPYAPRIHIRSGPSGPRVVVQARSLHHFPMPPSSPFTPLPSPPPSPSGLLASMTLLSPSGETDHIPSDTDTETNAHPDRDMAPVERSNARSNASRSTRGETWGRSY